MSTAKRQRIGTSRHINGEEIPSLETLPIIILDKIFELVQSLDLVNVAQVSKRLYWPAVDRIYKNVTIYEDIVAGNEFIVLFDFAAMREWQVNYGTLVKLTNLKKLIRTVKRNRKLAKFVKKVNFQCETMSSDTAEFLMHVPELQSLYDDGGYLYKRTKIPEVSILSCYVSSVPNLTPHLVELQFNDFDESGDFFTTIAQDMIASKSYVNLRKLQFSDYDSRDFPGSLLLWFDSIAFVPNWILFIEEFVKQGVKLSLNTLGLCGDLSEDKVRAIEQLRRGIHLENLTSLVLCCRDSTAPESETKTFTEMITKHTSSIASLEIYVSDEQNDTFLRAIDRSLRHNLPNQLKELSISYCPKRINEGNERTVVSDAIISSQRNLVKLKVDDRFWFDRDPDTFYPFEDAEAVNEAMENPAGSESGRAKWFPRIMESPHRLPHISFKNIGILSESLDLIYGSLTLDPIYRAVPKKMPFLEQYYYARMFIDTKKHGLIVNGKTKRFARDRAWDEGSDVSFGYPNSDYASEQSDSI